MPATITFKRYALCLLSLGIIYIMIPFNFSFLSKIIITKPIFYHYDNIDKHAHSNQLLYIYLDRNRKSFLIPFHLKHNKRLIKYILKQEQHTDLLPSQKQKLQDATKDILGYLQKYYPFDNFSTLTQAMILIKSNKFIEAYDMLQANYITNACYASAMSSRIALHKYYNLSIPKYLKTDKEHLEHNQCHNKRAYEYNY